MNRIEKCVCEGVESVLCRYTACRTRFCTCVLFELYHPLAIVSVNYRKKLCRWIHWLSYTLRGISDLKGFRLG